MSDRLDHLRRYVTRDALGVEVAPYFNPIVPKAHGYNALVVDVFSDAVLREKARMDPLIPEHRVAEIEAVDIIADASGLGAAIAGRGLAGQVRYIVSSHNFEHLPDPVSFLQGCARALAPGGVLAMAIPDCRACFDHFRMPTRLADWLAAYHRGNRQPAPETHLDYAAHLALYTIDGHAEPGCDIATGNPAHFAPQRRLREVYAQYLEDIAAPGHYRDAHCSTVFGPSFELMVRDLRYLGLIDLEVLEVTPTVGIEFFAYLRKPDVGPSVPEDDAVFYARRETLLRAVVTGLGIGGFGLHGPLMPGATQADKAWTVPLRDELAQALARHAAIADQVAAMHAKPWRLLRKTVHSLILDAAAVAVGPVMPRAAERLRRSSARRRPLRLGAQGG